MTLWRRWRYLVAQRSGRIRLAVQCLVLGVGIVLVAMVPASWQEELQAASSAAAGQLTALNHISIPLLMSFVIVGTGAALLLVPSRRAHPYIIANRSSIAPLAVYLDLENQLSHAELKPFIAYLRRYIGSRRADLLYYSDASLASKGKMYRELRRYGFRPVDVPHRHASDENVPNMVDVELSLHAYQRALLADKPLEIILIAADQDYLPLIYRLHEEGHRVSVWARALPRSFKSLETYLGITTVEFGPIFSSGTASPPVPASNGQAKKSTTPAPAPRAPQAPKKTGQKKSPAKAAHPRIAPVTEAAIGEAMAATREVVTANALHGGTPLGQAVTHSSLLQQFILPKLDRIGYGGKNWEHYWTRQLLALGVLEERVPDKHLLPGPTALADALDAHRQTRALVADATNELARLREDGAVILTELCERVAERMASHESADLAQMRKLFTDGPQNTRAKHLRLLLHCNQALGALEFAEGDTAGMIRVRCGTGPGPESVRESASSPATTVVPSLEGDKAQDSQDAAQDIGRAAP